MEKHKSSITLFIHRYGSGSQGTSKQCPEPRLRLPPSTPSLVWASQLQDSGLRVPYEAETLTWRPVTCEYRNLLSSESVLTIPSGILGLVEPHVLTHCRQIPFGSGASR